MSDKAWIESGKDFIVGYCIAAMERTGQDEETIEQVRRAVWDCLREIPPEDAERIGGSWY